MNEDEQDKQDSFNRALDTVQYVPDRKGKGPELQEELQELFRLHKK